MPLTEEYLQTAETRLAEVSPSLLEAFRETLASLPEGLSDDKLHLWVEEGLDLTADSRSWEASAEYFRVAPQVLQRLDEASFRAWVGQGRQLIELAAPIASAFFRASPNVLPLLPASQIGEWVAIS